MDNLDIDAQINQQDDTYYHEYVRLYLANIALTTQVKELIIQKNNILSRLSKYEDEQGYSSYDKNQEKNKRFRRTAHQIQRFYKCIVKNCEKSYGSQGSLNQHYKLKHPEIYATLPNVVTGKLDKNSDCMSQFSQMNENSHMYKYDDNENDKQNLRISLHNIGNFGNQKNQLNDLQKIEKKPTSVGQQPIQKKRTSSRVRKTSFLDNLKENFY